MAFREENPFGDKKVVELKPGHLSGILFLAMLVVVAVMLIFTIRVGTVSGTEYGILINNVSGNVEIITQKGTRIYLGIFKTFHTIDGTVQKLEMVNNDRVRIKTRDGSDVDLNLTLQYKVGGTEEALKRVVRDSGLGAEGAAYKIKWARDYTRSICRSVFGELSTEEFYDSGARTLKSEEAQVQLDDAFRKHGLTVDGLMLGEFRFYEEYEATITAKKEADQDVQKQQSLADAARQEQSRRRAEETKIKEVAITEYKGQMDQLVVAAKGQAERTMREADAYVISITVGAQAEFFKRSQDAAATSATLVAEAEGVRVMAEALKGEGGVNIVEMEYATRLSDMDISGQPFTRAAYTERFEHTQQTDTPAAARPKAKSAAGKGK